MKKDHHGHPADSRWQSARKRYNTPKLIQYGTIRALVKTGGTVGMVDEFPTMTSGTN